MIDRPTGPEQDSGVDALESDQVVDRPTGHDVDRATGSEIDRETSLVVDVREKPAVTNGVGEPIASRRARLWTDWRMMLAGSSVVAVLMVGMVLMLTSSGVALEKATVALGSEKGSGGADDGAPVVVPAPVPPGDPRPRVGIPNFVRVEGESVELGAAAEVEVIKMPFQGAVVESGGTLFYVPAVGYTGWDRVVVEMCDGSDNCTETAFLFNVVVPMAVPVVDVVPPTGLPGEVVKLNVLASSFHPDGIDPSGVRVSGTVPETLETRVLKDGSVEVTLPETVDGPVTVEVEVCSRTGVCTTLPIDIPLEAVKDTKEPDKLPPLPDSDGDGVPNSTDNCPNNANSNQADTNGNGIGDVCDSTPDPSPTNRPPVALQRTYDVDAGTTRCIDISGLVSDPDEDFLVVSNVTIPNVGAAAVGTCVPLSVSYTAPTEGTSANFRYTVKDPDGLTAEGNIQINIVGSGGSGGGSSNQKPVASGFTIEVAADQTVCIDVTSHVSDPDTDVLMLASVSSGSIAGCSGDLVFSFSAGRALGQEIVTYEITDGELTDSGLITIVFV